MTALTEAGTASAFASFFTDAATPVELGPDRYIPFDDVRKVLLVGSGAVDLFAVEMADGKPRGRWTFLNRLESGGVLIGTPHGPRHRIYGRPVPGSALFHLSFSHVESLSTVAEQALSPDEYQEAVAQFVAGVELGLVALAEALRDALPPREFVPLATTEATEVGDGQALRSVDGVRWVLIEEGAVEMIESIAGLV